MCTHSSKNTNLGTSVILGRGAVSSALLHAEPLRERVTCGGVLRGFRSVSCRMRSAGPRLMALPRAAAPPSSPPPVSLLFQTRTPDHLTEISTPLPWANKQREEEEGARRWEILTADRWEGCKRGGGGGGAGGGWKQIFSDSSPLPSGVCVPPSSEGSHGGVKTLLLPPSPALCLLYFMLPSSPPPPHSA